MPAGQSYQIKQVAMLAGRGISPFSGGAFALLAACQANVETAPGGAERIADDPVTPLAPSGGEVMPTHGFRIAGELPGQV